MKRLALLLIVPALVLMSDGASAQGKGKGQAKAKGGQTAQQDKAKKEHKNKAKKPHVDKKAAPAVVVIDRAGHHRVIHEYYTRQTLPPGLAKRAKLPPGLRAQLRERGALPSGIEKYWVVVPDPLIRVLPPVPVYYQRYFVGDDLVIVDTRRTIIVHVIPDVLPVVLLR